MSQSDHPMPPKWVSASLREGLVVPAHPLALDTSRRLDERRQRALTRYYHAAGVGGIAVGVHTTQFEIRRPEYSLFEPVLRFASDTITACDAQSGRQTVRIAGICGRTSQAVREARLAREAGYHVGLVSLVDYPSDAERAIVEHCKTVALEIPLFGFYLQPAVGGRILSADFWRQFATIPNVVAVKIAAFNRYQTLDVVRAIAEAGRAGDIALYTGNDDNIVIDLLTPFEFRVDGQTTRQQIVGGLLGHWAFWTLRAVELLKECKRQRSTPSIDLGFLSLAAKVTDCNSAVFDTAHNFAGCIPGIHEVLRRQGLLTNVLCLDPTQTLSPGQVEEIDRIWRSHPELNDDAFVAQHLDEWLSD
jgi:hypothetical protein